MAADLLIGGGIAVASALGLGAIGYRRLSGVMPFLFANARIQARGAKGISNSQAKAFSEKRSLAELASSLNETDYAGCFGEKQDVRAFHNALERTFVEKAMELREMSPVNFQKLLDAYLGFYEAKVLKAVYRSRFFSGEEDLGELVFSVGEINSALLQKLLETKTTADVNTVMASTSFAGVFSENFDGLGQFEVFLDGFVLDRFTSLLKGLKICDKKPILDLLNMKLDIINLLVLVKCIVRNVDKEERKKLLIKNNGALFPRLDSLTGASNLKELSEACSGLVYSDVLGRAFERFEKDGMLFHFEVELHRLFKKILSNAELYHFQGPFPLFSYLFGKEIEVRNLMAASSGIEGKFSAEEIGELLI